MALPSVAQAFEAPKEERVAVTVPLADEEIRERNKQSILDHLNLYKNNNVLFVDKEVRKVQKLIDQMKRHPDSEEAESVEAIAGMEEGLAEFLSS